VLLPTSRGGLSIGRNFSESSEMDELLELADGPGSDMSAQNRGTIID